MTKLDSLPDCIDIDGNLIEGGGQSESLGIELLICAVLRNSFAYACIVGKPVRIRDIRARRKKSGLKPQNMVNLQVLARLTGGEIVYGHERSREVVFRPGSQRIRNDEFSLDQTSGYFLFRLS
jgi:RNA 3'-terminal phosphate cyclase (ATP)